MILVGIGIILIALDWPIAGGIWITLGVVCEIITMIAGSQK